MTDRTDYTALIDAETWAFIRASERWYPLETASFTIHEQRQVYDQMCRAYQRPYPAGMTVFDQPIGGVPCRVYSPQPSPAATVLYLHGGGFVVGGLESHDPICAELAAATNLRVVSADYRLAPEHRHPAHFDDAWMATLGVAALWPGRLLLAGDSAGAALAASVSHRARKAGPVIAGQVLIYPGLGGPLDQGSALTHAEAPMLTRDDVLFYRACRYVDGAEPAADPTATALRDTDFSGLPPTLIFAAACDPLADDGPAYALRLTAAGSRVFCRSEAGLPHGYLRARHEVARARDSFAHITDGLAHLARGDWPDWARVQTGPESRLGQSPDWARVQTGPDWGQTMTSPGAGHGIARLMGLWPGQPEPSADPELMKRAVMNLHHTLPNLTHMDERVDMAAALRWTARLNMHEGVANHFSLAVDESGTRFLINPFARHFARVRASDLLLIDANDPQTMNRPDAPDPTAWGLHGTLHRTCPHARCIMHVHSIHATVLASLADSRLPPLEQNSAMFFGRHVVDAQYGGMAFADEAARCAALLSDPKVKTMVMGNHGVLIIGDGVADTFNRLYYFERAAEVYIRALQTGQPLRILPDDVAEKTAREWEDYPTTATHFLSEIKALLDEGGADFRK